MSRSPYEEDIYDFDVFLDKPKEAARPNRTYTLDEIGNIVRPHNRSRVNEVKVKLPRVLLGQPRGPVRSGVDLSVMVNDRRVTVDPGSQNLMDKGSSLTHGTCRSTYYPLARPGTRVVAGTRAPLSATVYTPHVPVPPASHVPAPPTTNKPELIDDFDGEVKEAIDMEKKFAALGEKVKDRENECSNFSGNGTSVVIKEDSVDEFLNELDDMLKTPPPVTTRTSQAASSGMGGNLSYTTHVSAVPRITRETMKQWNGQTAKRGVGFRSKLKKEEPKVREPMMTSFLTG